MRAAGFSILFFLMTIGGVEGHSIHLSVTNLDVIADSNRIDFSIQVFYEDFQSLINHKYNTHLNFELRNRLTSQEQEAILDYISATFQLIADKNDILATEFKGWKKEGPSIWFIFCTKTDSIPEIFRIKNTLLLELYNDQSNLLIIQHKGKEMGLEFDKRNTLQSITF